MKNLSTKKILAKITGHNLFNHLLPLKISIRLFSYVALSANQPRQGRSQFCKNCRRGLGMFPQQAEMGEQIVHPFSDFWPQKALLAETVAPKFPFSVVHPFCA